MGYHKVFSKDYEKIRGVVLIISRNLDSIRTVKVHNVYYKVHSNRILHIYECTHNSN